MNAIERAEADIREGDYGRARQRLESYIMAKGYDPELMSRLGEISYDMHDLFNAGRHWLVSCAHGEHVDRAIGVFLKAAGTHPQQIATEVLRAARLDSLHKYPEVVQKRLQRLGLETALVDAGCKRDRKKEEFGFWGKLLAVVCIVAFFAGVCVFIIGLHTIFEWLG